MGTRFIVAQESLASDDHKRMIVAGSAADILYTPYFSGVPGNYLKPSIRAAGLDPDQLEPADKSAMDFGKPKRWKDIWGSGQGIGSIDAVQPAAQIVARLEAEYRAARQRIALA